MITTTISYSFKSDISAVWNIVTNLHDTSWRSDISKTEVLENEMGFVEYSGKDFSTRFMITRKEPMTNYAFTIENKNMQGNWTGVFKETSTGTTIEFTECVEIKNPVMKLLAKGYLKKQQALYIKDLKKALGELNG